MQWSKCSCNITSHGGGTKPDGAKCDCYEEFTTVECIDGSGSDNSNTGGTNNNDNTNCNTCTGGTNSDDSNNTPDIATIPVNMLAQDLDNCNKLKNLMNKETTVPDQLPDVRAMLNKLKDSTTVLNKEIGWYLSPSAADQSIYSTYYSEGSENQDGFEMTTGLNVVETVMHIHYNNEAINKKQLSVPSLHDIYQIYRSHFLGNITTPESFTSFIVTEHGTRYAIQINNIQTFMASRLATQYFPFYQFDNIVKGAEDIYKYDYGIKPKKSNEKNEKRFAKFMAKENLGLTLFKANEDFTEWTLIKYENGSITETPCN